MAFKVYTAAMSSKKTPNPITMYNAVSESGGIHKSDKYMEKYDNMSDKKRNSVFESNLDIIHFVKDMFNPKKTYTKSEAKQFLKAYWSVVNIKKHGIWHMKRLLLEVTDPRAKSSRRGWTIHYQIEKSVEELMKIESDFKHLVSGANYILNH